MIIGDFGSSCYKRHQQKLVAEGLGKAASRKDADAILGIGDNIYSDGARDSSYMVLQWRDIYMKHSGNKRTWYALAGNHDWHSDVRVERDFTHHSDNTGGYWNFPSFWYKVKYETSSGTTVEMFHIDSMIWAFGTESQLRSAQKNWLKSKLRDSSADWKIVLAHHPYYSAGRHGKISGMSSLDKILRQNGVNMYIAGHAHSQHLIKYKSVYYIVSGAGSLTPRKGKRGYPSGSLKIPVIKDRKFGGLGFAHLEVCSKVATLTFYGADGKTKHNVVEIDRP